MPNPTTTPDGFLSKSWEFAKKHWIKITLVLLFCVGAWFFIPKYLDWAKSQANTTVNTDSTNQPPASVKPTGKSTDDKRTETLEDENREIRILLQDLRKQLASSSIPATLTTPKLDVRTDAVPAGISTITTNASLILKVEKGNLFAFSVPGNSNQVIINLTTTNTTLAEPRRSIESMPEKPDKIENLQVVTNNMALLPATINRTVSPGNGTRFELPKGIISILTIDGPRESYDVWVDVGTEENPSWSILETTGDHRAYWVRSKTYRNIEVHIALTQSSP